MSALKLAIPSKGRLKEQAEEFFANAGFRIEALGGSRGYFARIPNLPDVEVRLLSASEIASSVFAGDVHVGVSGEDLLREQAGYLDRVVHLLAPGLWARSGAAPKAGSTSKPWPMSMMSPHA
jgi:ATP phosphoribosyltransferase